VSNIWKGMRPFSILALAFAITFAMACTKEVEVEVVKEVPVEVVKEVEVEKVVEKEVAVEVVKEVIKEVQVEVAAEAVAAAEASEAQPIDMPASANASGQIVVAVTDVPPGVGLGSAQLADGFHYWGVGEATFQSIEGDTAAPMLASGYTLESDLSGGTLTIRDDVVFHGDWGPMTAADIAYTINDGNGAVNPRSIHWQAGDFAAMFGSNELTVIDDTTVGFTFNKLADGTAAFDPRWNANLLNDAGQAFSVQSTAVRDANGEDWMRDNPVIATGPFQIVEWKQDDVGVLEAVPYDHWLVNPEVSTFTFREVAEEATKAALMETGEVDAAEINLRALPSFVKGGFGTGTTGLGYIDSIVFSGNLWETHHVITGEPLDTAAVYMRDVQWVGNPIDSADVEEAWNVRNGLARAIDRDLINEAVLGGLGSPAHINVFCNCAPEWQSKWEFPYDVAAAEAYLDASGNTKNSNGVRFEMPLFANADHNGIRREVADAISGMWREVGVDAVVQKFNYSVYRPTIVARATTLPWITSGDDGKTTWPWDWPKGQDHTSLTRGGYGIGVELPFMATTWLAVAAEADKAKRIELNNALADHLYDEAIDFGVVNVPSFITYNQNSIASWDMDPSLFASWGQPEHITLK
jgi:ABC-type transport system substrate-binding protein